MGKSILVNVHFNNQNCKRVHDLYLFYKLRAYSSDKGGSVKDFKFTQSEKYIILKRVIKNGWVSKRDKKVNSYRQILDEAGCQNVCTKMPVEYLRTVDLFRAFLLASCESYVLNNRNHERKQERKNHKSITLFSDRNRSVKEEVPQLSMTKVKEDDGRVIGRVFRDDLMRLMGLGCATVSRWRSLSRKEGLNTYSYRNVKLNNNVGKLSFLNYRVGSNSQYYSKHNKCFIARDLTIGSNIEIFRNASYKKKKETTEIGYMQSVKYKYEGR